MKPKQKALKYLTNKQIVMCAVVIKLASTVLIAPQSWPRAAYPVAILFTVINLKAVSDYIICSFAYLSNLYYNMILFRSPNCSLAAPVCKTVVLVTPTRVSIHIYIYISNNFV